MRIVGVDLAWGERRGDGLCLLEAGPRQARVMALDYTRGDDALFARLEQWLGNAPALVMVDAPLVCPNLTGRRPVDGEVSRRFARFHGGGHPANARICPRPVRIGARLAAAGFFLDWDLAAGPRLACEVYPHPALIRWLRLTRIFKYKRGPAARRRGEFARLQRGLGACLPQRFPALRLEAGVAAILRAPWSKPVEDQLDALICALVGYQHWRWRGRRSEVLGDRSTGFILLPRVDPDQTGGEHPRGTVRRR